MHEEGECQNKQTKERGKQTKKDTDMRETQKPVGLTCGFKNVEPVTNRINYNTSRKIV